MPATKIKYTLKRLAVAEAAGLAGPEDWKVEAKIKREATGETFTLGDPNAIYEASNSGQINLDWTQEVNVEAKDSKFTLTIKATQIGSIHDTDVGSVEIGIVTPIVNAYYLARRSSAAKYTAVIAIDIVEFHDLPSGAGTTILQHAGATTFSSLHDELVARLVHICPVIPVPWADGLPPVPRGAQSLTASAQFNFGINPSATKLNALVNPAVLDIRHL